VTEGTVESASRQCIIANRLHRSGRYANHVLNDWFGHTGAIAEAHYLQVTEADFVDAVVPFVAPSHGKTKPHGTITQQKNPGKTGALVAANGGLMGREYTRQDSNLQPSVPKTDALSNCATGALR